MGKKEILEPSVVEIGKVLFDKANGVAVIDLITRTYYFFDACKMTPLLMDGCDVYENIVETEKGKEVTFKRFLGGPGAHEMAKIGKGKELV